MVKLLDKNALEVCQKKFNEKVSQVEITELLNRLGYTQRGGGQLRQSDVSKFMRANAMRYVNKHQRRNQTISEVPTNENKQVEEIAEIAMCNLPTHIKKVALVAYLEKIKG